MKWLDALVHSPGLWRWLMGGLGIMAGLGAIAVLVYPRALSGQSTNPMAALAELEQQIHRDYPTVQQVSPATAAQWIRYDAPPPFILDIREPVEYQVSHLAQAINVPPATPVEQVIQHTLSTRQPGQKILVYCSVGVRSSRYAQQLQGAGIDNVYNLQGSIFAWANQGLPLQRHQQTVNTVHGYDRHWEKYLLPQYRQNFPGRSPLKLPS